MKKDKKLSRLRAEVEILRSQLNKGLGTRPGNRTSTTAVEDIRPVAKIETDVSLSLPAGELMRDLGRTLTLTIIAFAFIFSLKVVILPNQATISQKAMEFYQRVTSALSVIKVK